MYVQGEMKMKDKQKQSQETPPYVSFVTFSKCITSLGEHGIPDQIDRSVLAQYSGGVQTVLLPALKFMGFTGENGHPTEKLLEYAKADTHRRKEILADILRARFPHQVNVLPTGTPQQLFSSFDYLKIESSVKQKCIAFFLKACKEAGLDISAHIMRGKRTIARQRGVPFKQKKKVEKGKVAEKEGIEKEPQGVEGLVNIPIPLGPDRVWYIRVDEKPRKEDVAKFTQIIEIVLSGKAE